MKFLLLLATLFLISYSALADDPGGMPAAPMIKSNDEPVSEPRYHEGAPMYPLPPWQEKARREAEVSNAKEGKTTPNEEFGDYINGNEAARALLRKILRESKRFGDLELKDIVEINDHYNPATFQSVFNPVSWFIGEKQRTFSFKINYNGKLYYGFMISTNEKIDGKYDFRLGSMYQGGYFNSLQMAVHDDTGKPVIKVWGKGGPSTLYEY